MTALIATAAAGVLFHLSTNLGTLWPLAWLAPAPVLWYALGGAGTRRVLVVAFAAFLLGEANVVPVYAGLVPAPMLLAALAVPAAAFAAAALSTGRLAPALHPAAGVLLFPALWTAWEYLFSLVSPHGTFLSIAYSQVPFLALVQVASVAGTAAITFLVSLVPSGIALALRSRPLRPGYVLVPIVAVASCLAFGIAALLRPGTAPSVRVGMATDGGIRARYGTRDRPTAIAAVVANANTIASLAAGGVEVVLLPEASVTLRPEWEAEARAIVAEAARRSRVQVVAPYDEYLPDGTHRNVADVVSPSGECIARYVKQHHLPGQDYQKGRDIVALPGNRGVAICKDMDFPELGRRYARAGAGLLLVPAWDFGRDGRLHAQMAWLRGVEGGFSVARCAEDGLLSVTDSRGGIVAVRESAPGATLAASVRGGPGHTLYSRTGDAFAWACVALAALLLAPGLRARFRVLSS